MSPRGPSLTPAPTARTPKADNAVMEQFNRAVKLLSVRASVTFTPAQVEGEHQPRPAAPGQRALGMSVSHGGLRFPAGLPGGPWAVGGADPSGVVAEL